MTATVDGLIRIGTAVELLLADAPRDIWLAARSTGIGGSDVSAILGVNRFRTPWQVWLEKTGRAVEEPPSWPMIRGTLLEPGIREWFTRTTGRRVDPWGLLQNVECRWMLYTPDGIVGPRHSPELFEAKSTTWWMREEWEDGQTADHAEVQVQWGMAVTGAMRAHVAAAIGDGEPEFRVVERDDALIADMIEIVGKFRTEHILGDVEPPAMGPDVEIMRKVRPELKPVGGSAEADLAAQDYLKFAADEKVAADLKRDAQARLLQAIGDGSHLVVQGETVATRSTVQRAGYTVAPTEYHQLRVPKARRPYMPKD